MNARNPTFKKKKKRFLWVFSGLESSFLFLVLNDIPLSECTTVYLSIHLLKDILVASKFWQL